MAVLCRERVRAVCMCEATLIVHYCLRNNMPQPRVKEGAGVGAIDLLVRHELADEAEVDGTLSEMLRPQLMCQGRPSAARLKE